MGEPQIPMTWDISPDVYASQLPTYTDPIMDRLDPDRVILYRLHRFDPASHPRIRRIGPWGGLNTPWGKVQSL